MSKKLMLIDGNSIINRAFYAVPLLTNSDGLYTNGVYGFINILLKFLDEEKPSHIAVSFDIPKPTFRHLKFESYKGTRKSMPEELKPQLSLLKNLLSKMEIPIFEMEGFEADDILATLAVDAEKNGFEAVIVSGDRDLLQIASSRIKIKIPKTKSGKTEVENYFESDVIEKMGVTPKEYIDVKALMGDPSDNIPGVPSIGEKTATRIILEYKNIETAILNAASIKPKKASENLLEFKEQAILSKELATIVINAPVKFDYTTEQNNLFNENSYSEVKNLEFKSLISRFKFSHNPSHNPPKIENYDYSVICNADTAKVYIGELSKQKLVSFSIIFSGSDFLGISCSCENHGSKFIRVNDALDESTILQLFRDFFDSNIEKVCLDSKKDKAFLKIHGIELSNVIFDCVIAHYLLDSSLGTYDYSKIASEFLNETFEHEENLFGKGKSRIHHSKIDAESLKKFSCGQSDVAFRCYKVLQELLVKNEQMKLYTEIELPLVDVLIDMEIIGIKVNRDGLIEYGEKIDHKISSLTEEIYSLAGEEFNINSPMQLSVILFEKLGLRGTKKTTKGYSTSAEVLEKLINKHEIISKILTYRTYMKLKSTYVDGLLQVINKETGKIHSTFNQTITTTGRISSTEPNLQNIPIKLELGRKLRKVFVPTNDEYIFLDGDYSQIELRVLAHMSQDETLINAFTHDEDIHTLTASQVFNTKLEEVTEKQRSNAKAVNFGIVYGMSAFSLSVDLSITRKEAEEYIEGYFSKYPKVRKFLNGLVDYAKDNGYAKTMLNRKRNIPEINSGNFNTRGFGERAAMNMPIQGTAADIIKIAMVKVHKKIKELNLNSRLILQIHDELLFEVRKDELEIVRKIFKEEMENALEMSVPLKTDLHEGESWYESK